MKKLLLIVFSSVLLLQASRVDDSFKKMQEIHNKKSYVLLPKVLVSGATHNFSSEHFTIYWGDNVPATDLWADYDGNSIPDFIENTSSILEDVWKKEVDELGFNKPFYDHIDVYIANTDIFLSGAELTVAENICGYAVYNGYEEYIVINDYLPSSYFTKPMDVLKITVAHEFFHLIQYTYALKFNDLSSWLYEGTAVLMEHIVFPEIPDYIYSYASALTENPNYGLLYNKGLMPYSTSLFFDYITNKYSLDVIKKIWQNFANTSSLEAVNVALNDYNTTLKKEVYNFYYSLENNLSKFSNSDILSYYPVKKDYLVCDKDYVNYFLPFGAEYIESSCSFTSFFNESKLSTFSQTSNNVFQINSNDMVVVYPNELNLSNLYLDTVDLISKNEFSIDIKEGWNLISFKDDINTSDLSSYPIKIVWTYIDDKWMGYSNESSVKEVLEENNITIDHIPAKLGTWIFANYDFVYYGSSIKNGEIEYSLSEGWNLLANPSLVDLNLTIFSINFEPEIIWSWDENNKSWNYYTQNSNLEKIVEDMNYTKTEVINSKGFWVKK